MCADFFFILLLFSFNRIFFWPCPPCIATSAACDVYIIDINSFISELQIKDANHHSAQCLQCPAGWASRSCFTASRQTRKLRSLSVVDAASLCVLCRNTWTGNLHLCGIPLTPQLDWQLQLHISQEDLAQVFPGLAGDPSHHLTSCADHHSLSQRENASVWSSWKTLMTSTWQIFVYLLWLVLA